MNKALRIIIFIAFSLAFLFSIKYTSWVQSWTGMGDFRSRVVGARQINDGISPYYQAWQPSDPSRYLQDIYVDTNKIQGIPLANLTVSPFFMRVVSLFAEHGEYQIDWGMYIFDYACFLICVIIALTYAPRKDWPLCLLLLIPITLTDGWVYHFYVVQQYMVFGFLFTLISVLLLRNKQIAAGLLMAILFLLRLNTLIFLLPFLLLGWTYRKFFIISLVGVALYGIFVLCNPFEQKLWQDYFSSLKLHQAEQMVENRPAINGTYHLYNHIPPNFEGTDYVRIDSIKQTQVFNINKESSNFKDVYQAFFHHYPSVMALGLLLLVSISVIGLWLLIKWKRTGSASLPTYKLIIAGLLFYFLSNFFSSVATVPYHLPQWWAMAVIYAIYRYKIPKLSLCLFVLGIIINFHFIPGFHGKHLLGELFLLASALWTVFMPENPELMAQPKPIMQPHHHN